MVAVKRLISWALLLLLFNYALVAGALPNTVGAVAGGIALGVFYIAFNIRPRKAKAARQRLRLLHGGRELMLAAMVCFPLEVLLYIWLLAGGAGPAWRQLLINGIVCAVLLFVMLANGILRVFLCSGQLGILPRLLLLLLWWVPVLNLFVLRRFFQVSRKEYRFTVQRDARNLERRGQGHCRTRYPLLLVHGIFFRDWRAFNYWGRIPAELQRNGAAIHYGSHQSSASVEQCAKELRDCVLAILEETGCEKVNIIAHSKGGLDCRYMISRLDMGDRVASLTTINTPHTGCNYVRRLLELLPSKVIAAIGRKYKSLYTKLGDDNPDFFSGLRDLTDRECARLNREMPDVPGVLYQSVGSRMRSFSGAMFPLNVGYAIVRLFGGGENDGLTSVESMAWGNDLGVLSPAGKQGISHGDVIDLTRKDIAGFDVCEFYVDLVAGLAKRGF